MGVNDACNKVKTCLSNDVHQVRGWTRGGRFQHAETWWWNDDVDQYTEKRRLWKLLKICGSKEICLAAKKCAERSVYNAKNVVQETHDSLRQTLKRTAIKSSNWLKTCKSKTLMSLATNLSKIKITIS